MRIAIAAPHFAYPKTGGVGPHARKLAESFSKWGDEVLIVSEGSPSPTLGYRAVSVGHKWSLRAAITAYRCILRFSAETVLIEYTPFNFGGRTLAPAFLALLLRLSRIYTVAYIHEAFYTASAADSRSKVKALLIGARDELFLIAVKKCFVANPVKKRRLRHYAPFIPERNVVVIPIGANIEPHGGVLWPADVDAEKTIISFGVVIRRRRIELLIDALYRLKSRGLSIKLLCIGYIFDTAYAEECVEYARTLQLENCFSFTGAIDDLDVSSHFASCELVVNAYKDGLISSSGSLLAALAHGCPIISTRSDTDEPDLINCVLTASADGTALSEAIEYLLSNNNERTRLAKAGLALYESRFAWNTTVRALRTEIAPQMRPN